MAPIPGWYDDPRDATQLRYWDGEGWTERLSAKPSTGDTPPQWQYPGAPPAQQQNWQYGAPVLQQQIPHPPGFAAGGVATPDGIPLTTWGKRVAAKLLDLIIVSIIGLPFTGYFIYRASQAVSDQLNDPNSSAFSPSSEVLTWEIPLFAIFLVVMFVYETGCLRRWGATPGKRVLEVHVRSYDRVGQLSWSTIARRTGAVLALWALSLVPILSILGLLGVILNYLWPLWDKRRQALHDKVAGTVVVEGHRPPSSASGHL